MTTSSAPTDSLRLAFVRQRYTPFGGAERFVERALQALAGRVGSITLITREWEGASQFRVQPCRPFHLGRLSRDRGFARSVCKHVAEADYDLVQSHERVPCCDVYRAGDGVHGEWLRQRSKVLSPVQRLAMKLNPYHRYVLGAEKRLFESPKLKAVICISRMVKDEVRQHFNIAEEKLHVIYNGIDAQTFHPRLRTEYRTAIRNALAIPADAPLFLFVGSGFERKGVATLLHAMHALPADSHLVVVGKDKHTRRYVRQAGTLGMRSRIHFAGPQKDVKPYYGAADAFVFPTLYEPFGNAVLEAMACGLPVVTSTKCGAADIIEQDVSGFVCDAQDRATLCANMGKLRDRERCQRMGQHARAAAERLTFEAMTRDLVALYDALIRAKA